VIGAHWSNRLHYLYRYDHLVGVTPTPGYHPPAGHSAAAGGGPGPGPTMTAHHQHHPHPPLRGLHPNLPPRRVLQQAWLRLRDAWRWPLPVAPAGLLLLLGSLLLLGLLGQLAALGPGASPCCCCWLWWWWRLWRRRCPRCSAPTARSGGRRCPRCQALLHQPLQVQVAALLLLLLLLRVVAEVVCWAVPKVLGAHWGAAASPAAAASAPPAAAAAAVVRGMRACPR
jgi:hypothetical protein